MISSSGSVEFPVEFPSAMSGNEKNVRMHSHKIKRKAKGSAFLTYL